MPPAQPTHIIQSKKTDYKIKQKGGMDEQMGTGKNEKINIYPHDNPKLSGLAISSLMFMFTELSHSMY